MKLVNKVTGETIEAAEGFNFVEFFFSWIWAFSKKLYGWGSLALFWLFITRTLCKEPNMPIEVAWFLLIVTIILHAFYGWNGNAWNIKRLREHGYSEPLEAEDLNE